jgi:protein-tyrosine phosphatase
MLHARRRAAAELRLRQTPRIRSVLFVCHGNLCRSPFAAAVFARSMRNRRDKDLHVGSAGFALPRQPAPSAAVAAASRRFIDLSAHRSVIVTARALKTADLVVVMAPEQTEGLRRRFGPIRGTVLVLGDLDPARTPRRTIVDPWGRDDAVFEASYSRIERCIQELVRILGDGSPESSRR